MYFSQSSRLGAIAGTFPADEDLAMVVVGNYRTRAELRKKPRRQFHYSASILIGDKTPPCPCSISDISASGARIILESARDLPERFFLLLNQSGEARRRCRIVWREGLMVGVEFPPAQS
jgi:hypothetical protein